MGFRSLSAKMSLIRVASKTNSSPLSLPLELKGKSLLVLLPAVLRDLAIIKQVLPSITSIFGSDRVFLCAAPNSDVKSIFPSKGFRIISPTSSSMNWCHLPSSTFLEKLKKHKFDYVFDTNLEENQFAARILLEFPLAVRFGCLGHLGLPYINLEVKTKYLRDRRLIYKAILEVISNLAQNAGSKDTVTEEQKCT
jgi:hypothetical protein